MAKILFVEFPQKCNGCELCVLESQRQLAKVGLDGALIRIFRDKKDPGDIGFSVELDPRINELDITAIQKICPTAVFTVKDKYDEGLIN